MCVGLSVLGVVGVSVESLVMGRMVAVSGLGVLVWSPVCVMFHCECSSVPVW